MLEYINRLCFIGVREMKATETSVLRFIGGLYKAFVIPPFQRNYEWDEEQCKELFDDIIASYENKSTHYLGNVVYYQGKNNSASYQELILVDGQQRITTILILLLALRDLSNDGMLKKNINNQYLVNDIEDNKNNEKYRIRLKQTTYDSISFKNIIDGKVLADDKNNIFRNYIFLKKCIQDSKVSIPDIYETIAKLEIVDVNLQIEDDLTAVQTVFEKINSTGKSLSEADLIRNFLLLANDSSTQYKLYNEYWLKIEERLGSENISRFSRDYLILQVKEDIKKRDVYKQFKINTTIDFESREDVLAEMDSLSKYYEWLLYNNSPNEKLNEKIEILNFIKADDVYPLALYLFQILYPEDISLIIDIFDLIIDFIIRYRVVGVSGGGGSIKKVLYQLISFLNEQDKITFDIVHKKLSNSSTPSGRFPNNNEFIKALKEYVEENYAKIILYKIECKERKNIPVTLSKITLEHLMPQTLSDWWIDYLGGYEEATRISSDYLNCIGNLAIMSLNYNAKLSNSSWDKKKEKLSEIQFGITQEVSKYSEWKENEIQIRNENIAKRATEVIWAPLEREQAYANKKSNSSKAGLYALSDRDVISENMKLQYIMYEDKKIELMTWADMVKKVAKICYDTNTELFEEIVKNNLLHKTTSKMTNTGEKDPVISKESKLLRKGKKISGTSFYIETNLSSSQSRSYLRELTKFFEITDKIKFYME
jgi:hypothetical protein